MERRHRLVVRFGVTRSRFLPLSHDSGVVDKILGNVLSELIDVKDTVFVQEPLALIDRPFVSDKCHLSLNFSFGFSQWSDAINYTQTQYRFS